MEGVVDMNIKASLVYSRDSGYIMGEEEACFRLACAAYIKNDLVGDVQLKLHAHPMYEFHLVLNGDCQIMFSDGNSMTIEKDSFVIIPDGVRHRIAGEGERFAKLLFSFQMELPKEQQNGFYNHFARELLCIQSYRMNENMKYLSELLVRLMTEEKPEYKNLTELYAYACIAEAAQIVVGNQKRSIDSRYSDERLNKAIEYIRKNVGVKIHTQDVADSICMSRRQLLRLFLRCFGCSIDEYIRRVKIEYANQLLVQTELPIAAVAERLGFSDASAFVNFYKRYEGITPSGYRKNKYLSVDKNESSELTKQSDMLK